MVQADSSLSRLGKGFEEIFAPEAPHQEEGADFYELTRWFGFEAPMQCLQATSSLWALPQNS